ncbi:hypothetical protein RQP46_009532 [Phenoliferia psychrophenolica]
MARPRAEFSSLPTELKSRIFQLVASQEDTWKARAQLDEGMEAVEKNTHVDGLVASSAVSKEWRAFAVEHLFTTVSAHRAQDPAFKYLILRNHADRFTKVILADAPLGVDKAIEQADWEYLLSIIPLLRNARSLVLSVKAADGLFGDELAFDQGAVLSSPQGMRQASFQGIVRTISDLTLLDFFPCKSARTLAACRGLRRFRLENLSAREWEDGSFEALAISLGKMTKLESLDISFTLDVRLEDKWPSDALAALRENPPPISSLRFFHYRHALSDFDFISTFSSTLTHLDLEISCLSDFFTPTILSDPLRQIPLPHLTTLRLTFNDFVADRASLTIFSRLLPSFTSSPITLSSSATAPESTSTSTSAVPFEP